MDKVYIVYKTDCHHSYASRDVIGIAETKEIAISLCRLQAKKENEKLGKSDTFNLAAIMQTQGYNGVGEFQFEEMKTNVLL